MANYFDQFEEIKEDNKQKSYWEQFEPIEAEAEVDEFDMDFQDPNKVTLGDRFNAAKDNLSKAIATTGQATMSNRPYVPNTSGVLEGGVNYINDLASQVGNSINNAGQSVKNAYNTIANKPINLMPSRLMQPVSNAFSGVGRVASDVLPYAMGGYYNSPKDIVEATQQAYNYGVEEAKRDRQQQQEMNPINLAESLVDMYTIGKFMPGNKATMLGRMGVAGKTGAVYGGLDSLKHKGINPKENIKDATVDAVLFATLEPLAEIGFAAAKEGAKRLNPANYQRIIESVPKTSGTGTAQRTVYEPKVKYEYKPNVKNEYGMKEALNKPRIEANKMSDNTAFELGEASELKYGVSRPIKEAPKKTVVDYLAPNIAAKQQAKALEKAEKAESNYEQVIEEARKHTIKTGEQTRVTKNDNGMYEYEVVKPEVANVDAKIAELERKMKLVGGEKTLLGQKYKRQIEELRGTEQAVAPVSEEVKPVAEEIVDTSQLDIKNKQLTYKFIDEGENIGENYGVVRAIGNNNEIVGEINYIYNPKTNTVQISDQSVIPSYQRQGIATDIISIIKDKTGTNQINSNVLTPDGEKFLAGIEKKGIIERHNIANTQVTEHPEVRSTDLMEQSAPKTETVKPTEEIQVAETTETTKPAEVQEVAVETQEVAKKPAKKNSIKYSVKIDKKGNKNGFYGYSETYHTDGNAMYKFDDVDADVKRVDVNGAVTVPEKNMEALWSKAEQNANKLEDLGKYFIDREKRKVRLFKMNYENGESYVFIDSKYLLNQKGLEVFAESPLSSMSVRKDGKQIGVVMPITMKSIDNVELIDVPKMIEEAKAVEKPVDKPKKTPKNTEKSTKNIEDSGEFLMGNKKVDKNGLTWEDLEGMNKLLREKNTTKAKIYPKPSMDDLKAEGYTEFQSALIQNIYNKINAKPAAGYEGEVNQKLYVDTVNDVMNTVKKYIKEHSDEFTTDLVAEATRAYRSWSYKYNKSLFDAVFPDTENKVGQYGSVFRQYPEYNRKAIIIGGNKFIGALQLNTRTLKDVMTTLEDSKLVKEKGAKAKLEGWEKQFTILEPSRWNNEYRVGIKKGRSKNNILDKKFNTKEEAEAYAKKMYEVYQEHKKRDIDIRGTRNAVERRENNKDVTSDEVREAFGFKGVNFGNWVKQSERQDFLNIAYDSLLDLAEIINVPAKAISLNGNLGLAFGAQGHGGRAAAHYLPAYKEINLTRMSGSGSLAHEWWHAVDNYFADMAHNENYSGKFALELKESGKLRPEVFEAFDNLSKQIKTAPFTEEELQKRKNAIVARCERNIKYYADSVKNTFKNVDGVAEFVDKLVKNKDKYIKMSDEDMHNLVWKDFAKLIPERRQTIENMSKLTWLTGEIQRIGKAEEIAMKTPQKSKYLQAAERLNSIDTGMGSGYWSEDTELGARAFASYILDKLEKQSVKNEFLTRKDGGILDLEAWSKSGESFESAIVPTYPADSAERERIFSAFDKLFETIKTRETEKGVELYSSSNKIKVDKKHTLHHLTNGVQIGQTTNTPLGKLKDIINSSPEMKQIKRYIRGVEDTEVCLFSQKEINELKGFAGASFDGDIIKVMPNTPIWKLAHEIRHARDFQKDIKTVFGKLRIFNAVIGNKMLVSTKNTPFEKLGDWWYNSSKLEKNAYKDEKDVKEAYGYSGNQSTGINARNRGNNKKIKLNGKNTFFSIEETNAGINEATPKTSGKGSEKDVRNDRNGQNKKQNEVRRGVEQTVRDKVYDWHGGIGKDRYDVDKTLNSFIRMSKNIAKDISQKTGLKVSDKQLREMLPFLRERTNIPEKLDRDDLKKIFNALSGEEKARLVKFADDTSNKFEKYYKNYLEAKGEVDEATIENHISHIWDLDDKKQALLTNYITTKSRFAKQRTIETLAKGINGIEIDGKIVEFKPKTLDYAEILKSSSDNLIKATYDMQLAETIKGMKDAEGNSLVLPAHKAPADWIEVSHPALNKAVYMGTVGEDELPMLMKSSVKIHPDLEKYVASIFETPKTSSKFWKGYDSINGILKQTQLGFSGFHGYALSESALANMGVKKTLDSLNVKKVYDAVKNGNYEIYEHEAEAKRAIDAGVQLGTPSDLNRNLVEETLNKIPVLGKYISGAVSVNNKILWDVLHNNFKLFTFNAKIAELEKAGKVTKEQERAVAQWVNDTYGGQSWELLGIKNSDVRKAGRVLLSPDWNFSTVRQALGSINNTKLDKVFNNTKAWKRVAELMGVSENIGGEGVRGKIARDFWIRAVVYSTIFYNAMNAAFRADDREKHPERYPKNMKPFDYSIWANANPMDNWYEKMMPYVFIGRNSDGTARMLRVGKQFREVPELAADPITKLSGKSASIIGLLTQVAVGMSPADIVKKVSGREAYLNQNIWEGYGEDARMRDGIEAVTGRLKVAAKGAAPFMLSKYIDGKHEPSAWDMFAQTSVGSTKGKVYKEAKEAFEAGREDKIREIKQKAYRDGVRKEDINKMVGYAEKNYKADNTKKYRKKFVEAMKNKDKKELNRIKSDMQRHHLSAKEQRRIYESAYKKYLQER